MVRLLASFSVVLATAWTVSCFSPKQSDGTVACGAGGACPPGFTCAGNNLCYRQPPGVDAAASIDARPGQDTGTIDATSGDDATIFDATSGIDALVGECNDGIDNDCDGEVDYPNDPGCTSALDPSEHGTKQCDDGIDNDGDNGIDYHLGNCPLGPTDPQCSGPNDPQE